MEEIKAYPCCGYSEGELSKFDGKWQKAQFIDEVAEYISKTAVARHHNLDIEECRCIVLNIRDKALGGQL